jgi:hypothetical protein
LIIEDKSKKVVLHAAILEDTVEILEATEAGLTNIPKMEERAIEGLDGK